MQRALVLSSALLLAACNAESTLEGYSADAAAESTVDAVDMLEPPPPGAEGAAAGERSPVTPEAQTPRLAYSYSYALELPGDQVAALAARHERACVAAGPTRCQVIGSESRSYGEDERMASLEIRAEPGWLAAFRNGLAAEAEAADGAIADSSTSTEDLTRALIDTEAHLRAKTALRDRLQTMLATRQGDLQTILEVERELARVQGEIDAASSTLAVMRARVAMSRMTLTYQSRGVLAPDRATAPLSAALNGALGLFMMALAVIVSVLAFVAPFALIGVPLGWFLLRRHRRRKAARAQQRAEAARSDLAPPETSGDPLHPE